jgi:alcohol dehydrogenase
MKRKAFRIHKAGSINNLKLVEEELAEPAENEVTIEVKAIGLNFADIFAIQGLYSATPKGSFIPGLEYSGTVLNKGNNVIEFELNDKVMGAIRFGAYTTHLNIDFRYVSKLPKEWSFEEGAAFVVQPLTAHYALVIQGNIKQGDTVLIHSAAGGVGIYANRIAKKFGAYTIGTIGSRTKLDFLKSEGYDEVIVRDLNYREKLKRALGKRELNLVLDSIGGKIFKDSFDLLSPTGRIMIYGGAQFMSQSSRPDYFKLLFQYLRRPKVDPLSLSDTNRSIMGFNLIYLWDKPDEMKHMLREIQKMNLGKPHIGNTFSFSELIDAVRLFQSGKTVGKVIVRVD